MKPRVQNGESVLIFPSAQFLYGLLGVESYSPAPVAFDNQILLVGELYEEFQVALHENTPKYIIRFKQRTIPFNDDNVIARWLNIDLLLEEDYQEIYSLKRFHVYQLKTSMEYPLIQASSTK